MASLSATALAELRAKVFHGTIDCHAGCFAVDAGSQLFSTF
jgi:hypothetical protein